MGLCKRIMKFFVKNKEVSIAIVGIFLVAAFLLATESGHRRDEKVHSRVIKDFYQGQMVPMKNLTNIPGYHLSMAGVAHVIDVFYDFGKKPKQRYVRFMSTMTFGVLFVIVTSHLLKVLNKRKEELFVIVTMPIMFLFILTVYTDIPALALLLLGYYFVLRKRHWLASCVFIATLLVRQDMITYIVGIIAIYTIFDALGKRYIPTNNVDIMKVVRRSFARDMVPYYILVSAFVGFVIINGGVAIGDKNAHPTSLHWGNIYNFFIMFFIIFLPIVLSSFGKVIAHMRHRWRIIVPVIIGGWFFYDWSFVVSHMYNFAPGFLHNDIVLAIDQSLLWRSISYGVVIISLMTLIVMRWRSVVEVILFAPVALVSLSLHWLIEPRYSMVPLLFSALWYRWPKNILWAQILYGLLLCCVVYGVFLAKDDYFL